MMMLLNKFIKYSFILFITIQINVAFAQTVLSNKKEKTPTARKSIVQVSDLAKPSLGSIGVKTKVNEFMGLDIWDGMEALKIVNHLNYIPDVVASKNLQVFLNELYISTSNPPNGSSDDIIKFLETRLVKIKSSGQSKKLYKLVKQLPEGSRWENWKRWLIEYELITRQDKKACRMIDERSKNNSDHFWQKARIFCLSINNKLNQAQFILDLIKTRGFSDPIFENLFQIINGEKDNFDFNNEQNKILPMHIILMDTLKLPIKVNFVANLSIEYTDPLLSLTYLTLEARSFLLDKKMNYSFVSTDQIIEDYKAVSDETVDIENAFSDYLKKPNGQNRANIWVSIITIKDDIKKVETILKFLKMEMKTGRFYDSASIYLPILNEIKSESLTKELNNATKKVRIAFNPSLYEGNNLANILLLKKNEEWNLNLISNENAWPIIPFVEKAGMKAPQSIQWLDFINKYNNESFDDIKFNKWDRDFNLNAYTLSKAIEQAANDNKKSLTILLIARLVGNNPLVDFDLHNLITVRKALLKLGFANLANNLTHQIMTSKILNF